MALEEGKDETNVQSQWEIAASKESLSTINPIRVFLEFELVDPIKKYGKEVLYLSAGDPAVYFSPHPTVGEALKAAVDTNMYNSMAPSPGLMETRQTIAEQLSKYPNKHSISANDIFMTCGTNGALEICFGVLCGAGKTILLPRPCFTPYKCLAASTGMPIKYYNLLLERSWEVDLEQLEKQVDENVVAILINNPSNPCGSVYSKEHLLDIISIAEKYKLCIVADEVYADMVFKGKEFHPIGSLSENVPVLTCSALSKKFMVPGWRCGWLAVHDRHKILSKSVKEGITNMVMKQVTPGAVIQAAIPTIFKKVPTSYHREIMATVEASANLCYSKLREVAGLTPIMPAGALYIMVKIDFTVFPDLKDDVAFAKCLVSEYGVAGVPGSIFEYPGSIRLALIMPLEKIVIACDRIVRFCSDHCCH